MKLIDTIIDAAYRRWCPIAEPTPAPQPKQEEGPYAKAMRAYQNVKWPPDGTFKRPRCGGMNHYGMQGLNALDEAGQPRRECMNYIRKPGGSWGPCFFSWWSKDDGLYFKSWERRELDRLRSSFVEMGWEIPKNEGIVDFTIRKMREMAGGAA